MKKRPQYQRTLGTYRRAQENTSVAGQTSRELTLIKKEKERRKL
jgi:hypothetical protein